LRSGCSEPRLHGLSFAGLRRRAGSSCASGSGHRRQCSRRQRQRSSLERMDLYALGAPGAKGADPLATDAARAADRANPLPHRGWVSGGLSATAQLEGFDVAHLAQDSHSDAPKRTNWVGSPFSPRPPLPCADAAGRGSTEVARDPL